MTNFFVNTPSETVILEPINTYAIYKNDEELVKLDFMTQKIGKEHATQVFTNSVSSCLCKYDVKGYVQKTFLKSVQCTFY